MGPGILLGSFKGFSGRVFRISAPRVSSATSFRHNTGFVITFSIMPVARNVNLFIHCPMGDSNDILDD